LELREAHYRPAALQPNEFTDLALKATKSDQIAQIVQGAARPNATAIKRKCFLPYPALRHAHLDPPSRPRNQKLHASSAAIRAQVS
jgi:hypothetical protein